MKVVKFNEKELESLVSKIIKEEKNQINEGSSTRYDTLTNVITRPMANVLANGNNKLYVELNKKIENYFDSNVSKIADLFGDEANISKMFLGKLSSLLDDLTKNLTTDSITQSKYKKMLNDFIMSDLTKIKNLSDEAKKMLDWDGEEMIESTPKRELDRDLSNWRRNSFKPFKRESDLMEVFGPYQNEVPPNVISYLRKNPRRIISRLAEVYGVDTILDYIETDKKLTK